MLSDFISAGDRIELQQTERNEGLAETVERKTYFSQIYDLLSEDTLEIMMPMEKTKLILLPVDGEFEMVVYHETTMYQCLVRIRDRYKSNNAYLLTVELISNLRKYQRREYYRFSCSLEMCARNLQEEELQAVHGVIPMTQELFARCMRRCEEIGGAEYALRADAGAALKAEHHCGYQRGRPSLYLRPAV